MNCYSEVCAVTVDVLVAGGQDPEGPEALPARGGEGPSAQHQPLQTRARHGERRRGGGGPSAHHDTPEDPHPAHPAGHRHAQSSPRLREEDPSSDR